MFSSRVWNCVTPVKKNLLYFRNIAEVGDID